jgi:hypothetical protein
VSSRWQNSRFDLTYASCLIDLLQCIQYCGALNRKY